MARTNSLGNFLTDVADAIRTKKGSEELIAAEDFDTEIENLPSGGADLSEYFEDTISFIGDTNSSAINKMIKKIPENTVVNITDLSYAFSRCTSLEEIPALNTSNYTNFTFMFMLCTSLTTISEITYNLSSAQNLTGMFDGCSGLQNVDIRSWENPINLNVNYMFRGCTALTHIDMRSFDFTTLLSYANIFGSTSTNGVPDNCEIIVADSTQKTWLNTKFSRLTNVKTVAEYEAEQNA